VCGQKHHTPLSTNDFHSIERKTPIFGACICNLRYSISGCLCQWFPPSSSGASAYTLPEVNASGQRAARKPSPLDAFFPAANSHGSLASEKLHPARSSISSVQTVQVISGVEPLLWNEDRTTFMIQPTSARWEGLASTPSLDTGEYRTTAPPCGGRTRICRTAESHIQRMAVTKFLSRPSSAFKGKRFQVQVQSGDC
jgi:hypothetical protein